MRPLFSDETDAVPKFLSGQGAWREDPDLGRLCCEVANTCCGQSAKDAAERGGAPMGVTIALDRAAKYAACNELRVVSDEILQ